MWNVFGTPETVAREGRDPARPLRGRRSRLERDRADARLQADDPRHRRRGRAGLPRHARAEPDARLRGWRATCRSGRGRRSRSPRRWLELPEGRVRHVHRRAPRAVRRGDDGEPDQRGQTDGRGRAGSGLSSGRAGLATARRGGYRSARYHRKVRPPVGGLAGRPSGVSGTADNLGQLRCCDTVWPEAPTPSALPPSSAVGDTLAPWSWSNARSSSASSRSFLAAARDGSGRVVLVGGEAGVGKTSLIRAFVETRPIGPPRLVGQLRAAPDPRAVEPVPRHEAARRPDRRPGPSAPELLAGLLEELAASPTDADGPRGRPLGGRGDARRDPVPRDGACTQRQAPFSSRTAMTTPSQRRRFGQ